MPFLAFQGSALNHLFCPIFHQSFAFLKFLFPKQIPKPSFLQAFSLPVPSSDKLPLSISLNHIQANISHIFSHFMTSGFSNPPVTAASHHSSSHYQVLCLPLLPTCFYFIRSKRKQFLKDFNLQAALKEKHWNFSNKIGNETPTTFK